MGQGGGQMHVHIGIAVDSGPGEELRQTIRPLGPHSAGISSGDWDGERRKQWTLS